DYSWGGDPHGNVGNQRFLTVATAVWMYGYSKARRPGVTRVRADDNTKSFPRKRWPRNCSRLTAFTGIVAHDSRHKAQFIRRKSYKMPRPGSTHVEGGCTSNSSPRILAAGYK